MKQLAFIQLLSTCLQCQGDFRASHTNRTEIYATNSEQIPVTIITWAAPHES